MTLRRINMTTRRASANRSSLRHCAGLMLMECLLAITVLSVAVLGVTYVAVAGQKHLQHSELAVHAIRLAEHLMEEIVSRPYAGSGANRASWHQINYHNFTEEPGELEDFTGELYTGLDQQFSRKVTITTTNISVPQLEGITLAGRTVTIVVTHQQGKQWRISQFIPEPVTP